MPLSRGYLPQPPLILKAASRYRNTSCLSDGVKDLFSLYFRQEKVHLVKNAHP